jgi:hypothetical protein
MGSSLPLTNILIAASDLTLAEKGLQTPVEESTKPIWGPDLIDQATTFISTLFISLKTSRSMNL